MNPINRLLKKIPVPVLFILSILGGLWLGITMVNLYQNRGQRSAVDAFAKELTFNIPKWELQAITEKIELNLLDAPSYLSADSEKNLVNDYLFEVLILQQLYWKQERLTGQENSAEMAQVTADIATSRATIAPLKLLAEDILEGQVSQILLDDGFGLGQGIYPPVLSSVTELPTMLIISPRDKIEQLYAFPLDPGMSPAEKTALEQQIQEETDLSAIVTNIGGLGLYPAMIIETSNLPYLVDVIGHEWSHNWMIFRPIGYRYTEPNIRTINETTASFFGEGVSEKVIEKYYPELIPPPTQEPEQITEQVIEIEEPPVLFDYRATMYEIRLQVDAYLAEGKIEAAETYMKEQRQQFIENGYRMRTLNQAYFAFHGAYANSPAGAAGVDPIGPKIAEIYQRNPTLRNFLGEMSPVDSLEELEMVYEAELP